MFQFRFHGHHLLWEIERDGCQRHRASNTADTHRPHPNRKATSRCIKKRGVGREKNKDRTTPHCRLWVVMPQSATTRLLSMDRVCAMAWLQLDTTTGVAVTRSLLTTLCWLTCCTGCYRCGCSGNTEDAALWDRSSTADVRIESPTHRKGVHILVVSE